MKEPVKVAVLGAGMRGQYAYAPFALSNPDLMKITAVAEPDDEKRYTFARTYQLPEESCFRTAEELLQQEKLADVAFVCTQDRQHIRHALAAMERGYDLLLEKPVATNMDDCQAIAECARKYNRRAAVCHVLRYTVFYQLLKFYIDSGRIGDIVSLEHVEHVGWWHMAHSFVRGNWRNSGESCPMILAKSCHDMDIIRWLIGRPCKRISSFGSLTHFRPEMAPVEAARRCLDGCKAKAGCIYDAEKIYLYERYGSVNSPYSRAGALTTDYSFEGVKKALETGPYGRCVYYCDNDVVDHQVVNMEFEDNITASFTMCAFSSKFSRFTRVNGTRGDIIADAEKNVLHITTFGQPTETVFASDYTSDFSGHGGGDNRMLEEFLLYIRGDRAMSPTLTTLDTSLESHRMALLAEESRLDGGSPRSL